MRGKRGRGNDLVSGGTDGHDEVKLNEAQRCGAARGWLDAGWGKRKMG
jgi:hypothetical protein